LKIYVIDTNVFIDSISPRSPYHSFFKSLIDGKFKLCISNEILLEYEEIISQKYSKEILDSFMGFISFSPHVIYCDPSYRYNLIEADPDDNKFVDCAICENVAAIVTSDKHFNIFKKIDYPKVKVLSPEEFIEELTRLDKKSRAE